ncbi:metallopeptidase TldD-related protein [Actinosynnema sp. NPDC059797]
MNAVTSPAMPTWDSVTTAHDAYDRAPDADEVELYVHDSTEATTTLEPRTPQFVSVQGRVLAYGCRLWRDGRAAGRGRSVSGLDDLVDLMVETDHALNTSGRPTALPHAVRLTPDQRGPDCGPLSMSDVERLAERTATAVRDRGGKVQAVVAHHFYTLMGITTRSGGEAVQYMPTERVQVRCETPHGPITDACGQAAIGPALDISAMVERYADALDALAGPGAPPPADLPVVFRPAVAGPLVAGLGWLLTGSTAVDTPGLARAVGKRLFPSCLSADDPGSAEGEHLPVADNEGHPVLPVDLVRDGRLVGFLHSARTASALDVPRNGRGLRMGIPGMPEPTPIRFRVAADRGHVPDDHVELSCRLDTMNPMPRTGQIELIAAGWVVRGGKRISRVAPFEFRCDVLRYWRQLIGTGHDPVRLPGANESTTPSLVFRGLP